MTVRLNYIGLAPWSHTGYGGAAAQYLKLLTQAGAKVHFQPLVPGKGLGLAYEVAGRDALASFDARLLEPELLLDAPTILHVVPEYYEPLTRWLRQAGATGRRLGMTVWETDRLPRHWPRLLNRMDGILVPSAWNRDIFCRSGVTAPIFCLAHASEFEGRPPAEEAIARLRARLPDLSDRFVFYSIAAQSTRKGLDLTLRAFGQVCAERPEAVLLLKTTAASHDAPESRWQRIARALRGGAGRLDSVKLAGQPNVIVLSEDLPSSEIAALHAVGQCFVSSSRGEGWGIGLFEAACFGNPVLAPMDGGHRAYLPDGMSGLVASRRVPVRVPGNDRSYTPDQHWYEIDTDELAHKMLQRMQSPERYQEEAHSVSNSLRRRFAGEKLAADLIEVLRELGAGSTSQERRPVV